MLIYNSIIPIIYYANILQKPSLKEINHETVLKSLYKIFLVGLILNIIGFSAVFKGAAYVSVTIHI